MPHSEKPNIKCSPFRSQEKKRRHINGESNSADKNNKYEQNESFPTFTVSLVQCSWPPFGMDDDAILCDCSSSSIVLCDLQHPHNTMILLAVYTCWMWCEHDVNALKEDQLTLLFEVLMGIVEPWSCQPNKEAIPALPRHWEGGRGDQI